MGEIKVVKNKAISEAVKLTHSKTFNPSSQDNKPKKEVVATLQNIIIYLNNKKSSSQFH
jgi:hypothetical protein